MDKVKQQWNLKGVIFVDDGERYPLVGIAFVIVLLLLAPFTSQLLVYPAFALCAYRIVRHDVQVFGIDMALLASFYAAFSTKQGLSLLAYVLVLGSVWYFLRDDIQVDSSLILLVVMLNYTLMRIGTGYSRWIFLITGLLAARVIIMGQKKGAASKMMLAFCVGLLITTVYALIFRNTWQLQLLKGLEGIAFRGTSAYRFEGLFEDPNYFAVFLITAMALAFRLYQCGYMKLIVCMAFQAIFTIFGLMSYSKTFVICGILLLLAYVYALIRQRKVIMAFALIVSGILVGMSSLFSGVGRRLASATNISDLTTGRTDIFADYIERIMQTTSTQLFGLGIGDTVMERGAHNIYLEILYHIGIVGLVLFIGCVIFMLLAARGRGSRDRQSRVLKYLAPLMMALVFCTLQGMFATTLYILIAVTLVSTGLEHKQEVIKRCQN